MPIFHQRLPRALQAQVYKGTWKGAPVAVKVMDVWLEAPGAPGSEANEKALLEAVLGKGEQGSSSRRACVS